MSESFDVIVVGAGPAGSSCARRAAELGLSVTVLEKSAFPRSKPCGAGLTERSLRLLNGEQTPVERHWGQGKSLLPGISEQGPS